MQTTDRDDILTNRKTVCIYPTFEVSRMIIEIQGEQFVVELYDNLSANTVKTLLPQKLSMSRWGCEYYGQLSGKIPVDKAQRDEYAIGEIAYWPPGNALCIFFGPTPASLADEPRMASPGVPLGRITSSNCDKLHKFGPALACVNIRNN